MSNKNIFIEAFDSFKKQLPLVDLNEAIESGKKNLEVIQEANQAFAEGAQAIVQKQVEIAQSNTEEAIKLFKDVTSSKDVRDSANKQAEFAKRAFEKATSDASLIVEMCSECNSKTADIVGKRFNENVKNIGSCCNSKSSAKKSSSKAA